MKILQLWWISNYELFELSHTVKLWSLDMQSMSVGGIVAMRNDAMIWYQIIIFVFTFMESQTIRKKIPSFKNLNIDSIAFVTK
jgi:hypothetical protein